VTTWVVTKIQEGKATINDRIPCHNLNCSYKIQITEIYKNMPSDCQEKINQALFEVYLISEKDIRKCPNSNCNYAGVLNKSKCSSSLECPACETQWKDYQQKTMPKDFKEVLNRTDSFKNGFLTRIRKYFSTKECPSCKSKIEKNGGCSHMTCSYCGFQFCWICSKPTPSHNLILHAYHSLVKPLVIASMGFFVLRSTARYLYQFPAIKFVTDRTVIPVFNFNKRISLLVLNFAKRRLGGVGRFLGKFMLFNTGVISFGAFLFDRTRRDNRKYRTLAISIICGITAFHFGLIKSMGKFALVEGTLTCFLLLLLRSSNRRIC